MSEVLGDGASVPKGTDQFSYKACDPMDTDNFPDLFAGTAFFFFFRATGSGETPVMGVGWQQIRERQQKQTRAPARGS